MLKKANNYNVDQIYYYHLRNRENVPYVTICVVRKGDEYARGISICSYEDMPVKKTGRDIARGRALKAIFNKVNDLAINTVCFDVLVIDELNVRDKALINVDYKSEYMPDLTVFEKVLFGLIERNMN